MKKIIFSGIITFFSFLSFAQNHFIEVKDDQHPQEIILQGLLSKDIIKNDRRFTWYPSSQASYQPTAQQIASLSAAKSSISFLIFGGTWCEDTQFILPKFFKWMELSEFSETSVVLFGVNRKKESMGQLSTIFDIKNVPTIIVMKNGQEIGRVIEYGKSGKWDNEIMNLITR
jgi:thiol-disulfide isomerase/thioredoxin